MDEPTRYAAAWRDRKLRFTTFKATQIAGIPIIIAAAYLSKKSWLAPSASLLAIPIWFTGYMLVGVWLNRFRCPRCGQLYYWNLQRKGYMERQKKWRDCRHCGLQQDSMSC